MTMIDDAVSILILLCLCVSTIRCRDTDIVVSLRGVVLRVSHTECTAFSTICSFPSMMKLWIIVHIDMKVIKSMFVDQQLYFAYMHSTHRKY